jgi:hypothetical protein
MCVSPAQAIGVFERRRPSPPTDFAIIEDTLSLNGKADLVEYDQL